MLPLLVGGRMLMYIELSICFFWFSFDFSLLAHFGLSICEIDQVLSSYLVMYHMLHLVLICDACV